MWLKTKGHEISLYFYLSLKVRDFTVVEIFARGWPFLCWNRNLVVVWRAPGQFLWTVLGLGTFLKIIQEKVISFEAGNSLVTLSLVSKPIFRTVDS